MKNKLKFLLPQLLSLAILFVLLSPIISLAQTNSNPQPAPINYTITLRNPLRGGTQTIPALIESIINNAILPIGGVVAALMIIYAGFMYVTARGDTTKIATAHKALLYAAIGAAILLGARVLAAAIQTTVNQIGGQP